MPVKPRPRGAATSPRPGRPRRAPARRSALRDRRWRCRCAARSPRRCTAGTAADFARSTHCPRFWIVPLAFHGRSRPPIGHGPQTRGSIGPNSVTVGQPVAAARWRHRGIRPDIDARALQQRRALRPRSLMRPEPAPCHTLIEIPPFLRARAADRDHAEAALAQPRGQRPPALGGPLLVAEHRRGMDHGIMSRRERFRADRPPPDKPPPARGRCRARRQAAASARPDGCSASSANCGGASPA